MNALTSLPNQRGNRIALPPPPLTNRSLSETISALSPDEIEEMVGALREDFTGALAVRFTLSEQWVRTLRDSPPETLAALCDGLAAYGQWRRSGKATRFSFAGIFPARCKGQPILRVAHLLKLGRGLEAGIHNVVIMKDDEPSPTSPNAVCTVQGCTCAGFRKPRGVNPQRTVSICGNCRHSASEHQVML